MLRATLAAAAALLACAAPAAAQTGISDIDESIRIIQERTPELIDQVAGMADCLEPVPSATPSVGASPRIELRVLGLLEGVSRERAERTIEGVREAYAPLGIDVVATYRSASFSSDDPAAIIDESKTAVGGARPSSVHLVWAFTSRDIGPDDNKGVAGQADCIGGISDPQRAFVVSEANDLYAPAPIEGTPFVLFPDADAVVAAHEFAHLLGAHHHMASCAEGMNPEAAHEVTPCTLMTPDIVLTGLRFGTVEKGVVRGYSEAYVEPIDEPMPPSEL